MVVRKEGEGCDRKGGRGRKPEGDCQEREPLSSSTGFGAEKRQRRDRLNDERSSCLQSIFQSIEMELIRL